MVCKFLHDSLTIFPVIIPVVHYISATLASFIFGPLNTPYLFPLGSFVLLISSVTVLFSSQTTQIKSLLGEFSSDHLNTSRILCIQNHSTLLHFCTYFYTYLLPACLYPLYISLRSRNLITKPKKEPLIISAL